MRWEPIVIPRVESVDELRLAIVNVLNRFMVRIKKVETELGGDFDANRYRIRNLKDPVQPSDAATKAYVDSIKTTQVSGEGGNIVVSTATNIAPFVIQY